jgi:hypothetical protein
MELKLTRLQQLLKTWLYGLGPLPSQNMETLQNKKPNEFLAGSTASDRLLFYLFPNCV